MRRLAATLALLVASGLAGCGEDDENGGATTGAQPSPTATEAAPQQEEGSCRQVSAPAPKPEGEEKEPKEKLDPDKKYELEVGTSCGRFTIELDAEAAPNTSASLVALARNDFYDGTTFHRIVPGFVIQGGDPTASGSGGPGYSTRDKPPSGAKYTTGVVAMAKTPEEPPGTAGSQFYVVTGSDAGLPPEYAIVGSVSSGLDVVQRIGLLGDPASGEAGTPTQPVVIDDVEVKES